ncbi:hypothetical protein [Hydrogenovibrio marinus]|uniref:DUF91 domain-containing protein n=1 Tax=Hydrogenovibrio marinus TaxID=28885 RepID=A0A067A235_HYDMR|nr:hypothetical protein [Hydrogenovibrio marinus]KDN96661.1 hypothetical protein EI16_10445 [Hydrogenovibrio marinus]BBN58897.1 hypothetical protein HVMH_0491 [Hydrogenovibrio marinus]
MAIYSFESNSLQKIETTTFNSEGILERQHLQNAIKQKIDVIAPNCLVISEEFSEWSDSQRRIDLLAIDKEGNLVVIELKRTETGEHMELQALRYAAMVSTLTFKRATEIYQKYLKSVDREEDAEANLIEFLDWRDEPQEDDFGLDVRIILVSANFSKELTTSVIWLNERSLDIRCVRLTPYKNQDQILIDVQQIIPLPEAENYQVKIKKQSEERREARRSNRDYTRYQFMGNSFNKRKLVLAVVQHWIKHNNPETLSELIEAFPQDIKSGGVFINEQDAKEIYERYGIYRHFLGEGEVIEFSDSSCFAISNQWGVGNIEKFINQAKVLGYEIEETN